MQSQGPKVAVAGADGIVKGGAVPSTIPVPAWLPQPINAAPAKSKPANSDADLRLTTCWCRHQEGAVHKTAFRHRDGLGVPAPQTARTPSAT